MYKSIIPSKGECFSSSSLARHATRAGHVYGSFSVATNQRQRSCLQRSSLAVTALAVLSGGLASDRLAVSSGCCQFDQSLCCLFIHVTPIFIKLCAEPCPSYPCVEIWFTEYPWCENHLYLLNIMLRITLIYCSKIIIFFGVGQNYETICYH